MIAGADAEHRDEGSAAGDHQRHRGAQPDVDAGSQSAADGVGGDAGGGAAPADPEQLLPDQAVMNLQLGQLVEAGWKGGSVPGDPCGQPATVSANREVAARRGGEESALDGPGHLVVGDNRVAEYEQPKGTQPESFEAKLDQAEGRVRDALEEMAPQPLAADRPRRKHGVLDGHPSLGPTHIVMVYCQS